MWFELKQETIGEMVSPNIPDGTASIMADIAGRLPMYILNITASWPQQL